MAQMSDYLEEKLYNHVFRGAAYTAPSAIYMGLFLSDPKEDASGAEVSGGGYARQQITMTAPVDGEGKNQNDIIFPIALTDWGTITHVAIFDALTGGNMLVYMPISNPKTIEAQMQFRVPPNYLSLAMR
jgi:hypothetical protein